jgi:hypothetical protein
MANQTGLPQRSRVSQTGQPLWSPSSLRSTVVPSAGRDHYSSGVLDLYGHWHLETLCLLRGLSSLLCRKRKGSWLLDHTSWTVMWFFNVQCTMYKGPWLLDHSSWIVMWFFNVQMRIWYMCCFYSLFPNWVHYSDHLLQILYHVSLSSMHDMLADPPECQQASCLSTRIGHGCDQVSRFHLELLVISIL